MNESRSQKSAGGSQALSIVIEGSDANLVAELSKSIAVKLENQRQKVLLEASLRSREENILTVNQYMLDTTTSEISAASLSLLVMVKLRQRLKETQEAKAHDKTVISNTSWLGDAYYYEFRGKSDIAKQIIADCGMIRPDVWVVIDEPHGVYAKLAKEAGIRVYSPKLTKTKLTEAVLEHITYSQKKQKKSVQSQEPNPQKPEKVESNTKETAQISELAAAYSQKQISVELSDSTPGYFNPDLGPKVLGAYKTIQDKIISNFDECRKALLKNKVPSSVVDEICSALLPMSTLVQIDSTGSKTVMLELSSEKSAQKKQLDKLLTSSIDNQIDGDPEPVVKLVGHLPRNELDLANQVAFMASDMPATDINASLENQPITTKEDIILTSLRSGDKTVLSDASYTFDILSEYLHLKKLRRFSSKQIIFQSLTPRYGYDIPPVIEENGLVDLYQQSFDLSLELHSLLQSAGFEVEAQYAVLQGHRLRFRVTLTASELRKVLSEKYYDSGFKALIKEMRQQAAEVHPLIWTK